MRKVYIEGTVIREYETSVVVRLDTGFGHPEQIISREKTVRYEAVTVQEPGR